MTKIIKLDEDNEHANWLHKKKKEKKDGDKKTDRSKKAGSKAKG